MPSARIDDSTISAALMRGSKLEPMQRLFGQASAIRELYKKTAETASKSKIYVGGNEITFPWDDTKIDSQRGFDICGKIASAGGTSPEENSESLMLPLILGGILPELLKNLSVEMFRYELLSDDCKVSTRTHDYQPVPASVAPVIKLQRTNSGWEVEFEFIWKDKGSGAFNMAFLFPFSVSDKDAWGNNSDKSVYIERTDPYILECMQWVAPQLGRKEEETCCEPLSNALTNAWNKLNNSHVVIKEFYESNSPRYIKQNLNSRTYKIEKPGESKNIIFQVPSKPEIRVENVWQSWQPYALSRFQVPRDKPLTTLGFQEFTQSVHNLPQMRDSSIGMKRYDSSPNVPGMAAQARQYVAQEPQQEDVVQEPQQGEIAREEITPKETTPLVLEKKKNGFFKKTWKKIRWKKV